MYDDIVSLRKSIGKLLYWNDCDVDAETINSIATFIQQTISSLQSDLTQYKQTVKNLQAQIERMEESAERQSGRRLLDEQEGIDF